MTSTTTTPAPAGLRERRRERTLATFARAAFELASVRGVDGFTIDELAEATGLARRTFFNHFMSKEEAVAYVVVLEVRDVLAAVELPEPTAGTDSLRGLLAAVRAITRSLLSPEVVATFRALGEIAERHPQLIPQLSRVENDAKTRTAALLRTPHHGGLSLLGAQLVPSAVISTVDAVATGRIPVVEIDGDVPDAVTTDWLVDQLVDVLLHGVGGTPPA